MSKEPMGYLWLQASGLVDEIIQAICAERCNETYDHERVKRLYALERRAFRRWKRRDVALRKQHRDRIAA